MTVVASISEVAVSRIAAEVALVTKEELTIPDRVVTETTSVDQDQTAADTVTLVRKVVKVVAAKGEVEMTGAEIPTAKEEEITSTVAAKVNVSIDTAVVLVEEEEVVVESIVIVIEEMNQLIPVLRLVWRNVTPVDPS